jgi:hypothetical protein
VQELAKDIIEIDRLTRPVRGEEVLGVELEFLNDLVAGEDHVGNILVDGGVEDVEDGVKRGLSSRISRGGGDGAVDMAEVACTPERRLHVDGPLSTVEERTTGPTWRGALTSLVWRKLHTYDDVGSKAS